MTTTKHNDKISRDHKKEFQDEARRLRLLLKSEYDILWTDRGWSIARKSSGLSRKTPSAKETQTTSTSMFLTSYPIKNPIVTKSKSRKPQTDVGNSDDILLLSTAKATVDKSHMTPTMCTQSATPTNMWLQMSQELKQEGRQLRMRNRCTKKLAQYHPKQEGRNADSRIITPVSPLPRNSRSHL